MTISVCIASSLRDMGEVKIPLIITIIATLTNTLFNYLLIYGHFGLPRLEVKGTAIATVIARMLELLLFIIVYIKKKPDFAVKLKDLIRVNRKLFKEMLKKCAMVLFCEMVWIFSETIMTALYNGRGGADVVSGMSSSFTIANLFFVAFGGIYSATGVIIGKSLGEGNLKKVRQEKTWMLSGAAVMGIIMVGVGFSTTLIVPLVFSLAIFTKIGPVMMYLIIKLLDIVKVTIFHFWLKREIWLRNLTKEHES
ncbi:MAG: polysaccharide biosynthesis C-terminal domain-containing protein [Eubacterium sp.]|nr:polysaccharide biosynthesis C-terminal domain-containing protein [Eubacterium sp.]